MYAVLFFSTKIVRRCLPFDAMYIHYNLDMRQSACLVVNSTMVDTLAFFFNFTAADLATDSVTAL